MTNTVAIIGAGQLGSRHLQGLARTSEPFAVFVVDPSQDNLETARQRWLEVAPPERAGQANFLLSISGLPAALDLAVVATNSNVRCQVVTELCRYAKVRSLILEKFLFQKAADFSQILNLTREMNINAWVNCPRRRYSIYQEFRGFCMTGLPLVMNFSGTNWGLACNAIHFADLFSFLSGVDRLEWNGALLDKGQARSKRPGFLELTGTIAARTDAGGSLTLSSIAASEGQASGPGLLTVHNPQFSAVICESQGWARVCTAEGGWKPAEIQFKVPYQSELTGQYAEAVTRGGNPGLTTLEESCALHLPLLGLFMEHLRTTSNWNEDYCPVT
jgi:hypothetical protein